MSRSYKKENVTKDYNPGSKPDGSRRMRRKTKSKLRIETVEDEDMILPKDKSEVMNDYDVCDYSIHWDKIDSKYANKAIRGKKIKKVNK